MCTAVTCDSNTIRQVQCCITCRSPCIDGGQAFADLTSNLLEVGRTTTLHSWQHSNQLFVGLREYRSQALSTPIINQDKCHHKAWKCKCLNMPGYVKAFQ